MEEEEEPRRDDGEDRDDEDRDGDRRKISRLHLTLRDKFASTLEDLFDFHNAPSLHTTVTQALPPASDCTPK